MRLKRVVALIFLEVLKIVFAQDFHPMDHQSIPSFSNGITPTANVTNQISNIKGTGKGPSEYCPSLENADLLTDEEFFEHLVHPCRYDRIQRPKQFDKNGNVLPVNVFVRSFVYYLQNLDTHELQFKMQTLLQMRYVDPRLTFKSIAPKRDHPVMGEEDLRKKLWVPHVFFSNERDSGVLGTYGHHILTSIYPDGTVIISSRLQATLFCPMDLRKFPFDSQECRATLECWMYNASQVQLHWEENIPLTMGPDKILTEYVLRNTSTSEAMVVADKHDLRHGAFIGNYSSITFKFKVDRQAGFYMLEYFLPSIMIVAISWVSFYLQADQTAPRAMLGATSMLSFITLSSAQNKILPKVSYIKALEVWSMGCTAFIFMSLVEFAFANVIWRRKKHVELKKVNAANILKHTLTAREIRKVLGIDTSRSVANLPQIEEEPKVDKCHLDKRRSVDLLGKISANEDEFENTKNRNRSNSCTEISKTISATSNNATYNMEFRGKTNISFENDENFKKFDGFIHNNSISQPTCEKKTAFVENIMMHDNHQLKHHTEKKTKFDMSLPRIDSETSLHKPKVHIDNVRHRRKSYMIPVILTEGDNGDYKMEMDATHVVQNKDNSIEILIDNESDISSLSMKSDDNYSTNHNPKAHHHNMMNIYDGWTRMTPHEISHWIDKRSRTFFPFAFVVFNVFYWTYVYIF